MAGIEAGDGRLVGGHCTIEAERGPDEPRAHQGCYQGRNGAVGSGERGKAGAQRQEGQVSNSPTPRNHYFGSHSAPKQVRQRCGAVAPGGVRQTI